MKFLRAQFFDFLFIFLVPFVAAIVPTVDIAAGTVTLTPPAGLFEDLPDPDPEPESTAAPASVSDPEA